MKLYAVTINYQNTDGHESEAVALVGADDASEAVSMAASAVSELPHCAKIIAGQYEELPEDYDPANTRVGRSNAPAERTAQGRYRPPGITVH
jgi:hypothetical protein